MLIKYRSHLHGLKKVYIQSLVWNLEISLTQTLAQKIDNGKFKAGP